MQQIKKMLLHLNYSFVNLKVQCNKLLKEIPRLKHTNKEVLVYCDHFVLKSLNLSFKIKAAALAL